MTYTYTANGRGLATLKTEDLEKTSDSGWGPSDGRSNVTSEYSVAYGGRTHMIINPREYMNRQHRHTHTVKIFSGRPRRVPSLAEKRK